MLTNSTAQNIGVYSEKKNKSGILSKILIIASALTVSFLAANFGGLVPYIIALLMLVSFILDTALPISIYIPATFFGVEFGALSYAVLAITFVSAVISYYNFIKKNPKTNMNKWLIFAIFSCFAFASVVYGENANFITAILTITKIISFYCFCDIFKGRRGRTLEFSLVISGAAMMLYTINSMMSGEAIYLYDTRLTFEESVRNLANAIAFAIYFSFSVFVIKREEKLNLLQKIVYVLILGVGLFVLISTYSRGVLLAVGVSCIVVLLFSLKKVTPKHLVGISLIIILAIYLINSMEIDEEVLTYDVEGGSGRFEIWGHFINAMVEEGPARVLFGYGPGDFKRITAGTHYSGLYAHSVFMDFLFSFGILGFLFIIITVIKIAIDAIRSKNSYAVGLLLLTILMYVSHGNSSEYQFYLMLGFAASQTKLLKKSENVISQ